MPMNVKDIWGFSSDDNEDGEKPIRELTVETTFKTNEDSRRKIQEIIKRTPALSRVVLKHKESNNGSETTDDSEDGPRESFDTTNHIKL